MGANMRCLLVALIAVGCGGKEQAFDVVAYCEGQLECEKDSPYFPFERTMDECIFQWESERDVYTDEGCGVEWDDMEYCMANEELSCVYGSYASTACLGEIQALSDCVQALFDDTFETSTTY